MGSSYCTREDVLAILSQDSEARLTADPKDRISVGTGDGWTTVFDTPFTRTTAFKGYVNGAESAATVVAGGNEDTGLDQVSFTTAPANEATVAVAADSGAINTAIIDLAIKDASDELDSYIPQNITPFTTANLIRLMRPKAVFLVKWRLRRRRDQQEWDPMVIEYRQIYTWLQALVRGDIQLPSAPQTSPDVAGAAWGGEDAVFGPPYSVVPGRDY